MMKIDLTCPIELVRMSLPRADYPACDLQFNDLTDRMVTSVEVTLVLTDDDGDEKERVVYRAHDLDGRPGSVFAMTVPAGVTSAHGL